MTSSGGLAMNGFGRDVDNTFPGLHFDIEELSSCGAGGVIVIGNPLC